jgi:uncharacterized protein involved in outer membrane biogenesis
MKKKLLIIAGALLVIGVVAATVVAMSMGAIVKKGIETVGPMVTKTSVKLDSARVSILSGSGSVRGLVIGNPEGFKSDFAIRVGSASLGVAPGSLFSDKIHVTHVRVEGAEVNVEADITKMNVKVLLDNVKAAAAGSEPATQNKTAEAKPSTQASGGKKIQVDEFVLSGTKVNVSSPLLPGKPITLTLADFQVSNLGQGSDGITAVELINRVMQTVLGKSMEAAEKELQKAVTDNANKAVNKVGEAGKAAGDTVNKALKGLFK